MIGRGLVAMLLFVLSALTAAAHESRPAYLEVREIGAGRYDVVFKRPMIRDRVPGLTIMWPEACISTVPGAAQPVPGGIVERSRIACGPEGLAGRTIAIDGLGRARIETLARIAFSDGTVQANLVRGSDPYVTVYGPRPTGAVAVEYFVLGGEHILMGVDHLLFVLALTLIVRGTALLVKTITAFTVAHSVTLALATLGYVAVPQAPVEAVIALSILFLASELAKQHRGEMGLTARSPWIVAFAFGLLHGFGFAGALTEVGLPQSDVPMALLTFNLGVEAGQLAFIAAVLGLMRAGRLVTAAVPAWLRRIPDYAIGSVAAFWLIERVATF